LNYTISRLCDDFITYNSLNYETLNKVIGVLACVQQELYRRVVAPYEDFKMQENGDVFNAVDEVEAMGQLVDPPEEPTAAKHECLYIFCRACSREAEEHGQTKPRRGY
jgi:hypothetical protein